GPGGHWHARPRPADAAHDHLDTPAAALEYLVAHGVAAPAEPPDETALEELRVIRSAVHGLADRSTPLDAGLEAMVAGARFRLDATGRIASDADGWRAFARDLLLPLLAMLRDDVRPSRCSNPACRLLFQDRSRNHGRRWCDTAGCGNRDRVRRARRRPSEAGARQADGPLLSDRAFADLA
ncbi:MAG TPA: CGNR zinc finger domain-containing protein, partial [Candidatus Dormibacteraeota bacterium]|nr:CGNR zinc finger domain-containing protein [Candidatus Dormibacteraeota bacterium]